MLKKILITGGAGFIGSNLTEYLLKKNFEITIIDNFSTGKKQNINNFIKDIKLFEGDISNIFLLKKALKNIEAIIHLAAIPSVIESIKNPLFTSKNNLFGTITLLDTIEKFTNIKKIIQASSSAVYGESLTIPISEDGIKNPLSPYAIDKLTQEYYASFFSKTYNFDIISLRFFNVFGPKQDPKSIYSGVIPLFIKKLNQNKNPIIYGDGSSIRDFIYIKDLCAGIHKSLKANLTGHNIFNLGTGIPTNIKDLAFTLIKLMNKKNKIKYEPNRKGEIHKSLANINKAKKILKFNANYSLKKALKSLLNNDFNL